jgi:isopenicillin N synthase-like dioxygenase
MKRTMTIIVGIFCMVFITGCIGDSPSKTARKFFTALVKNDKKTLEKTATPEMMQMIAIFDEKEKGALSSYGEITDTAEEINGDTAKVTLTFANGETSALDLVKVKGKWKVTFTK